MLSQDRYGQPRYRVPDLYVPPNPSVNEKVTDDDTRLPVDWARTPDDEAEAEEAAPRIPFILE